MPEDPGLFPGLGRPPGKGNGKPLKNSHQGNSTERGAQQATVHEDTIRCDLSRKTIYQMLNLDLLSRSLRPFFKAITVSKLSSNRVIKKLSLRLNMKTK